MARMHKQEKKTQVTLYIKDSMLEEVDALAKKMDLSRSQQIVNLMESGLDDARLLNEFGAFDIFMAGGRLGKSIKELFYKGKASLEAGELKINLQ